MTQPIGTKVFAMMKSYRRGKSQNMPDRLDTPLGTYHGADVLEGFAADAEELGRHEGESFQYDNDFYRLCVQDNLYIFQFKGDSEVKIPKMSINDLNTIIEKNMKRGKACDIYQLTAEHLKYAGEKTRYHILNLINDIIDNIYYLTCPQAKIGLSTAIHKRKRKPLTSASSYRRVTVTPQLGSILDRFIDPMTESIFRPRQSPDQYGFTKGLSYLMASVVRGECQRWALDEKKTCFGVSFDGKAAFPSVEREIQIREIFAVGERGDFLNYSKNTYQNTESTIKINDKMSRQFREYKGSRQGHSKASGHFKTYINPCLEVTNKSNLGFNIGSICVTSICVADDTYILSDCPRKLQAAIDIVAHYGLRYRVVFGADKTKATVTGLKIDMQYYKEVNIWTLYDKKIAVTDENEHLGLIVSGSDEEKKNIDENMQSCRRSLFSLLGPAFAYDCKLSPGVQTRLWRTYCQPVLRSGLAALPIRPVHLEPLCMFQHYSKRISKT